MGVKLTKAVVKIIEVPKLTIKDLITSLKNAPTQAR